MLYEELIRIIGNQLMDHHKLIFKWSYRKVLVEQDNFEQDNCRIN